MTYNIWLGNNELIVLPRNGCYAVEERFENWAVVFEGGFFECREYMEGRWLDYMESIVG